MNISDEEKRRIHEKAADRNTYRKTPEQVVTPAPNAEELLGEDTSFKKEEIGTLDDVGESPSAGTQPASSAEPPQVENSEETIKPPQVDEPREKGIFVRSFSC